MDKRFYVALIFLVTSSVSLGIALAERFDKDYPQDMRFYMYCEECSECGYKEKEVEYSVVSNIGFSSCNGCNSTYEFELNKKGDKVIIEGNKR